MREGLQQTTHHQLRESPAPTLWRALDIMFDNFPTHGASILFIGNECFSSKQEPIETTLKTETTRDNDGFGQSGSSPNDCQDSYPCTSNVLYEIMAI
ncbi:hypothetical protein M3Y98_00746200 [Aphelenchoides besseyi]|nr:hypothetical protein M3Y98_00746200 [Aphelenchoides besseyi]